MWVRKRQVIGGAALLGMALALLLAAMVSSQLSTERGAASVSSDSESGQVRGDAGATPSIECEPGFVEVVATNGKEGYVAMAPLDAVTLSSASEDEAQRARAEHREKAAVLLRDEINRFLPADQAIDHDEAKAALQLAEEDSRYLDPPAPQSFFFANADPRLAALDGIGVDEWLRIWRKVGEGMTVTIPVYARDGQTVIGEFPISLL